MKKLKKTEETDKNFDFRTGFLKNFKSFLEKFGFMG